MSGIKLKPCPFCGGAAFLKEDGKLTTIKFAWVKCRRCDCRTRICGGATTRDIAVADAVAAWNRRADTEKSRAD